MHDKKDGFEDMSRVVSVSVRALWFSSSLESSGIRESGLANLVPLLHYL